MKFSTKQAVSGKQFSTNHLQPFCYFQLFGIWVESVQGLTIRTCTTARLRSSIASCCASLCRTFRFIFCVLELSMQPLRVIQSGPLTMPILISCNITEGILKGVYKEVFVVQVEFPAWL